MPKLQHSVPPIHLTKTLDSAAGVFFYDQKRIFSDEMAEKTKRKKTKKHHQ
ncbi:hypothetical protein CHCC20335_2398 [Bacillus paralicheniformis]|nr:hypothetical protein CHCC20335_2398 [Bacillus paralicheniformis]